MNDHSQGITIWTDLSSVFFTSTRLTDRPADGQADRRTDEHLSHRYSELSWHSISMHRGKKWQQ